MIIFGMLPTDNFSVTGPGRPFKLKSFNGVLEHHH